MDFVSLPTNRCRAKAVLTHCRWRSSAIYRPKNDIPRMRYRRATDLGLGMGMYSATYLSNNFNIANPCHQLWKEVTIQNADVGFRLLDDGGSGTIGSVSILDSAFWDVGTGIIIAPVSEEPGTGATGVALENVAWYGSGDVVKDSAGTTLLAAGDVDSWILGPNYGAGYRVWYSGEGDTWERPDVLLGDPWGGLSSNPIFEKPRPSYQGYSASDFAHLKDYATGESGQASSHSVRKSANERR